jgi:hypothetical protein
MKHLLLTAFCALGLAACGGGSDSNEALLRVVHNSPDAPAVDVRVNGGNVLEDVTYLTASDFLSVNEGKTHIQVLVAGTDTAVINADLNLAKDTKYTVLASNLVSKIQPFVLETTKDTPMDGNLLVRVSHGAPSAPAVDIYVTAPGANLNNSTPVLKAVPFGTTSGYLEIPQGDYQLRVTVAGTKTVAIDSGSVSLASGKILTVLARDAVGAGAPFSLGILEEQ